MSEIKVSVTVEIPGYSTIHPGSKITVERTAGHPGGNPRFHAEAIAAALTRCTADARKQVVALFGDKPSDEERAAAVAEAARREHMDTGAPGAPGP